MDKITRLEEVKANAKALARCVDVKVAVGKDGKTLPVIESHPFIDNQIWVEKWFELTKEKPGLTQEELMKVADLTKEDVYKKWLEVFDKRIDSLDSALGVYMMYRDPYKLLFMKYNKDYLSDRDFAEFLANAWVTEDNPNMDVNVSRRESLSMFKKAKKEYLMEEDDYKYYQSLPDTLTLYRGVGLGRVELGLSWTDDEEKAKWFMHRWELTEEDEEIKLLKAVVPKKYAIAYFNTRNEKEVLLDVFAAKNYIERIL